MQNSQAAEAQPLPVGDSNQPPYIPPHHYAFTISHDPSNFLYGSTEKKEQIAPSDEKDEFEDEISSWFLVPLPEENYLATHISDPNVLVHTFSFLRFDQVLKCGRVSRLWNKAAKSNILWYRFYAEYFQINEFDYRAPISNDPHYFQSVAIEHMLRSSDNLLVTQTESKTGQNQSLNSSADAPDSLSNSRTLINNNNAPATHPNNQSQVADSQSEFVQYLKFLSDNNLESLNLNQYNSQIDYYKLFSLRYPEVFGQKKRERTLMSGIYLDRESYLIDAKPTEISGFVIIKTFDQPQELSDLFLEIQGSFKMRTVKDHFYTLFYPNIQVQVRHPQFQNVSSKQTFILPKQSEFKIPFVMFMQGLDNYGSPKVPTIVSEFTTCSYSIRLVEKRPWTFGIKWFDSEKTLAAHPLRFNCNYGSKDLLNYGYFMQKMTTENLSVSDQEKRTFFMYPGAALLKISTENNQIHTGRNRCGFLALKIECENTSPVCPYSIIAFLQESHFINKRPSRIVQLQLGTKQRQEQLFKQWKWDLNLNLEIGPPFTIDLRDYRFGIKHSLIVKIWFEGLFRLPTVLTLPISILRYG